MSKRQSGFTLIELMIVVAIIAILAAIAIPAYNRYINEANVTKVSNHYDEAVHAIKAEQARITAIRARKKAAFDIKADPGYNAQDAGEWMVNVINPDTQVGPAGTAAYAGAAVDAEGVVGIEVADDGTGTGVNVTVTRPAYDPAGDGSGFAAQEVKVINRDSKVQ